MQNVDHSKMKVSQQGDEPIYELQLEDMLNDYSPEKLMNIDQNLHRVLS